MFPRAIQENSLGYTAERTKKDPGVAAGVLVACEAI
jgi:hypothetical protein